MQKPIQKLRVLQLISRKGEKMDSIKGFLGFHGDALALRSRRNEILASNIANAATPNFKARDIDFDTEMAKYMPKGKLDVTNSNHMSFVQSSSLMGVKYRVPTEPSLDGNTVELPVEQMEFSENVMQYQTSLTFLNRKISSLMSAIKEE
ncbi:MAG: flagellar basal body rod protein FlgB [Paracoccaceae bacterium]|nr:flagellar basal body rod protein FlgB [Paracoccaceae bacterium]MDO7659043.1 flagellar basal body rod protein FlgB [Paracoccaceae bacterium]MDP5350594.1 flagellar basal body rod protein FlgB [Paracoccaceae bacterium]